MAISRVAARRIELDTVPAVIDILVKILGAAISPPPDPHKPSQTNFKVTKVPHLGWVARTRQLEGQDIDQFPYIGIVLHDLMESPDYRYNQQALYNGLPVAGNEGDEWRFKLSQVRMNFGILIRDDSEERVLGLISRFHYRERDNQIKVNIHGLRLPLKLQFDKGFSVPEMEPQQDGNLFTIQTSVTAYFYVGEREQLPSTKSFEIDLKSHTADPNNDMVLDRLIYKRYPDGSGGVAEVDNALMTGYEYD